MKDFDLSEMQTSSTSGMDAFLSETPSSNIRVASKKGARVKVASLKQLDGFVRVAADTLVNLATEDLWSLKKDGNDFYIERLFKDDGTPIKG